MRGMHLKNFLLIYRHNSLSYMLKNGIKRQNFDLLTFKK